MLSRMDSTYADVTIAQILKEAVVMAVATIAAVLLLILLLKGAT